MKLVEQWRTIEAELPAGWVDVAARRRPRDGAERPRAASIARPGEPRSRRRRAPLHVRRGGGARAVGPSARDALRQAGRGARSGRRCALVDVDGERRRGAAERRPLADRVGSRGRGAAPRLERRVRRARLRLERRPRPRPRCCCAPLNPTHVAGRSAFRFRVATGRLRRVAEMVARCLARLDAEEIRGEVEILRVLCETGHVATQGPVFRVGGQSV